MLFSPISAWARPKRKAEVKDMYIKMWNLIFELENKKAENEKPQIQRAKIHMRGPSKRAECAEDEIP